MCKSRGITALKPIYIFGLSKYRGPPMSSPMYKLFASGRVRIVRCFQRFWSVLCHCSWGRTAFAAAFVVWWCGDEWLLRLPQGSLRQLWPKLTPGDLSKMEIPGNHLPPNLHWLWVPSLSFSWTVIPKFRRSKVTPSILALRGHLMEHIPFM